MSARPGLAAVMVLAAMTALPAVVGCAPARSSSPVPADAVVVAHHDTELPPALGAAERAALRSRVADHEHDDLVVAVLAAGDPAIEQVDLEPRRPNGQIERGPRRDVLVEQRLQALDAAIDRAAQRSRNTDLLGTLGRAVRLGPTTLHLLSSGISAEDPFDMRVSGWDVDPRQEADDLVRARALPQASGRTVVLSGLGRVTGRQPTLDEAAERSLHDQWTAVCAATGARCLVDDGPRPLRLGVVPPQVGPVVPVERLRTRTTPGAGLEVSLPSSVLFAAASCRLRDPGSARVLLTEFSLRLSHGASVSISGRTAPVGPGDGTTLAACRAQVVAELLRVAGAPAASIVSVTGDGSLADPPDASRDADGRPDPTTYPGLRRVVLVLTAAHAR